MQNQHGEGAGVGGGGEEAGGKRGNCCLQLWSAALGSQEGTGPALGSQRARIPEASAHLCAEGERKSPNGCPSLSP